jgi:hypothetical protein
MSNVVTIEPKPPLEAGSKPAAIVPTNFESAYRLANAVCAAGMAPKGLEKPEQALVAILHGLEIGLTPMTALQRIAVVNGRPTIWGDGAISLVRGSNACEWIRERIAGDGESMKAICEAKRRGESEPIIGEFSVADAKKAGLWNKSGPWQQYPKRMLQMRARAFCLRDGFADVLGGLYLREEIEDNRGEQVRDGQPSASRHAPPPPPPPVAEIEHKPAAEMPAVVQEVEAASIEKELGRRKAPPSPPPPLQREAVEHVIAWTDVIADYKDAAEAAKDVDQLDAAWGTYIAPHEKTIPRDVWEMAAAIDNEERGRLE